MWDKCFSGGQGINRNEIVSSDHKFSSIIWEFGTLMVGGWDNLHVMDLRMTQIKLIHEWNI